MCPPKIHVEILIKVIILVSEAFGKQLSHEGGILRHRVLL